MKQCYSFARFLFQGVALFFFLLLTAPGAWAQASKIYYTQGSSTATLDAAKVVNPDGTGGTTLASAAASFAQPTDIAFDVANGYIYVADQYMGTGGILRFTTAGTGRTVIVPATAGATYNGLALDAASNRLYFTQGSATNPALDAVKVVNLSTTAVTTLVSGAANFTQPTDLALDAVGGFLYVADQYIGSGGILRFTTAGASRTVIVPAAAGVEYSGLALDVAGNRLFFTQGSATATLDALKVASLSTGFTVTSLASGAASFTQPTDLAYDAVSQQLYVTDQFVSTGSILRYSSTGTGRTVIVPATAGATYNGLALATNAAPVVTTSGGNTTFTQSLPGPSTPVAIDPAVTVTDDNATLASATVSITGNYQSAQDVLAFSNVSMGNIAIASNTGGVLTLTSAGATATVAQWQAALRAVTYTNTAAAPNISNRTVSFMVNDGAANSNTATKTIVLTRAGVVITSVGVPANGTYRAGQNLDFTVNFNTSVTVVGTPSLPLTLDTGGGVQAAYLSGSGTAALVFRYTVASGNLDATGVALGTALALNGGTIRDAASQDAALTLNSVASTSSVLVDGVAPTVTSINRQNPAAASTNATTLVYRITFSEGVNGVGPTDFALTATGTATGSVASATLISSSVYDVTVNSVSGNGTLRLDLNSSGTGITDVPGNAIGGGFTTGQAYTLDTTAPVVTITSTASNPTSTSPIPVTVTFSENVTGFSASGVTVTNGTVSGFTPVSGTTYTFNVTPTTAGTVTTVNVPANMAQDAVGNGNTAASQFSITYNLPAATVVSVTNITPSPTATATVSYQVVFSSAVTGATVNNFSLTTGGTISGASVSSVSGSGTTYTVTVNTGTGNGTLLLNVANSTGLSPTVSNVPYTSGFQYTITKSFAASPQLTIVGVGGTGSDVTAFVDVVQVLSGGSAFANGLQNGSFETHDAYNNGGNTFSYNSTGATWTFNARSGIADQGSAFTPVTPIPNGIAVAFVQSSGGNGQLQQNLAVPTGSNYQVSFQTAQRGCCTTADQALNVFLNGVFLGNIQPPSTSSYSTFTSATFAVTAPALTATITSTASNPTSVSPIPVTVTFSQSVTGFSASGITVTNGTVSGFSGSGTTYTFNVTPSGNGLVTVNVPTNVAVDANNTGNSAATQFAITYGQLVTAAPVVVAPATGNSITSTTPGYTGTAPANATVTVYVDGTSIGTTTATAGGNWALTQPTALAQGAHTVYATAQLSGQAVSANSSTNTFTVDSVQPTVVITSSAGASGSITTTTPLPFTVTFSEVVSGFSSAGVTVSNGTVSGFAGSGTTYTFTVTPTTAGTATTVSVTANQAQDAATNGNVASSTYSLTYTITSLVWTGAISTDWFTAGNWSPNVVPTASIDATIPAARPFYPVLIAGTATTRRLTLNSGSSLTQTGGTLDVRADLTNNGLFSATGGTVVLGTTFQNNGPNVLGSSNTRFWNLTVNSNGVQLSTSASTSVQRLLTLNGALVTQSNPFTLESNSTGTALVVNNPGGFVFGTATVQRYIDPSLNAGLGYRHYSAPVGNTTVADLATGGFSPVVNPAYNSSATPGLVVPFPTVFGYDQSRLTLTNNMGAFDKGFVSPTSTASPLTVGQGYTVNIAGTQLVDFVGALNNGNQLLNLSRNAGPTAADAGWQLLGNPYPAPLDYSLIDPADRPNLDAAIYVFSSTSQYGGQYRSYTNGVGNPVVPVAQGFFTRVSPGQTSGSLTLRNSHRLTSPDATTFQRTTETRPLVQLTLRGATGVASDEAYVYFQNGATAGIDPQYDAVKLPNSTGLNLSSTAVSTELAINGLPLMGSTALVVPLTVYGPASGTYTLQAAQVLNFAAGEQPFLHDLQQNTLIDLSLQPTYTFTLNATSTAPRFELVFGARQVLGTASATLAAQVAVFPNPAHAAVSVELPASLSRKSVTAALVDGLGRVVLQQVLPAGAVLHKLPLATIATGVYSLRLQTEAGVVVKKLVVE